MDWIIYSDIFKFSIFLWSLFTCLLFTIYQIYVYTYTSLFIFSALILGIQYFRNAQPPKSCVRAILGRDPNEPDDDDGSSFTIHTVAHRGMGLDAPENTIASFKYSLDRGIKMIELDVSLTKDDIPIIFHDYDLSRLTGLKTIVKDTKWADLKKIDIAAKHPLRDRFPNSRIATLEETLDFCLENNMKLILDLKSDDFKIIQILIEQFKKRDMYHSVMVSGFNPLTLYKLRRADPNIVCSIAIRRFDYPYAVPNIATSNDNRYQMLYKRYLWMTGDCLWWMCHAWIVSFIGISSILLNREAICTAAVNYWRARNIRLMAWTVNHPAEKLYYVKCLKTTYLTDTYIGETSAYNNNDPTMNSGVISPTVPTKDPRLTKEDKRFSRTENGKMEIHAQ